MAKINFVTKKTIVFIKAGQKWLTITKALGYYTKEFIMAIKSFIIGVNPADIFEWILYLLFID